MAKLLNKTAREISGIVKKIDDLEKEQDKAMNAKKYNDLATDIRLLCLALQAKAEDLNRHAEIHYDISRDM